MLRSASLLYYTSYFFFFNDTATTEIYTLSLHDALPICFRLHDGHQSAIRANSVALAAPADDVDKEADRKRTRLNSSHLGISYAVFCLKKKKKKKQNKITIENKRIVT